MDNDPRGELRIGRDKTRINAKNVSLVLKRDTSLAGLLAALEARLRVNSKVDVQASGRVLLSLARSASVNRQLARLEAICDLIFTFLPETHFANTALYYKARCLHQRGSTAEARLQLGSAIELAPEKYRPGAMLALACTYLDTGEISEFRSISREAAKAARGINLLSETQALRNVAVAHAILGDHKNALSMLVALSPVMREIGTHYPADLLNHQNNLAIELGEAGRVDEANSLIDSVLSSPLAENQPEWHDTKSELATKSRWVFTPFAMALGAPPEAESKAASSSNSEDLVLASVAAPEHLRQLWVTRHCIVQALNQRLSVRRKQRRRPHSPFTTLFKRMGYTVSPPSRAPPSASPAI